MDSLEVEEDEDGEEERNQGDAVPQQEDVDVVIHLAHSSNSIKLTSSRICPGISQNISRNVLAGLVKCFCLN